MIQAISRLLSGEGENSQLVPSLEMSDQIDSQIPS